MRRQQNEPENHFSDFLSLCLIRFNKMQQYAGIYLLHVPIRFGCPCHPSSGVHETVTAAFGTGHSI